MLGRHHRVRALRGIARVRHAPRNFGTCFLVADSYLFTASHCLPKIPDSVECFPGADLVEVQVCGHKNGPVPKANAVALVAFVDPCSDMAILGDDGSGGELEGERRLRLWELFHGLESLTIRQEDFPIGEPVRVHCYTSRCEWISGSATLFLRDDWSLSVKFSSQVPGGTSGGPVIDDAGHVVGVVSSSGEVGSSACEATVVYLPNALPRWMWNFATAFS